MPRCLTLRCCRLSARSTCASSWPAHKSTLQRSTIAYMSRRKSTSLRQSLVQLSLHSDPPSKATKARCLKMSIRTLRRSSRKSWTKLLIITIFGWWSDLTPTACGSGSLTFAFMRPLLLHTSALMDMRLSTACTFLLTSCSICRKHSSTYSTGKEIERKNWSRRSWRKSSRRRLRAN